MLIQQTSATRKLHLNELKVELSPAQVEHVNLFSCPHLDMDNSSALPQLLLSKVKLLSWFGIKKTNNNLLTAQQIQFCHYSWAQYSQKRTKCAAGPEARALQLVYPKKCKPQWSGTDQYDFTDQYHFTGPKKIVDIGGGSIKLCVPHSSVHWAHSWFMVGSISGWGRHFSCPPHGSKLCCEYEYHIQSFWEQAPLTFQYIWLETFSWASQKGCARSSGIHLFWPGIWGTGICWAHWLSKAFASRFLCQSGTRS